MATPEEILRQRLAAQPSLASLVPQPQSGTLQQIASGQPMDIGLPPPPNPMMPQVPQEAFNQAYDQINPPVPAIEAERQRSAQEDSWVSRALQRGFWTYGPGTVGGMVGWFGSAVGNDAIKDAGLRLHQYSAERAYMRPRDVKGVGYIHGVGDTAKWAGESIIEFFPQMVAMALGAKGMQMAGNKALSTQTGREAADALLGAKISKEASKLTARGVDPEVATNLARKRLQDQALIRLGAGLQVGGAYTGSSWAEVLQEHGVDDPTTAAMVGAGAGALTMLMGGQVAAVEAVLGRPSAVQFAKALNTNNQNVLTRIASEFARVAPPAMLEEYAQESLALLNLIYHDPDVANAADAMVDEYMRNIGRPVESALTVGVAAGVPGAIARGTLTPRAQPEATTSDPEKEAVVSAATSPTPTQGVKQPIAKEYDDLGPFVKPATGDNQIGQGSIIAPLSGKGRPLTVVGLTETDAVISDQQTKQVSVVPLQELVKKYGLFDYQGWLDAAQRELPLTGGRGTKPSVPKSVKLPGKEISREEIVYPTREEALRHAAVGEQPVQVAGGWQLQTTQLDLIAHPQLDRDVLIARGVPKGIAVKLMDMSLEEANDWVTRQEQRAMAEGRKPSAAIDAARSVIEDMRRNQDAISDAAITKPEAVIPTPDNEARPGQLDLPLPDMGPLPYRGVDRRRDPERRKSVAQMSEQERVTELLIDRQTGLWNKRAWEEADRKPYQIFIDLDGLKWVNDNMGHEAGDQFLALMGDAVRSVSPDGYHFSGDEFVIQANTPEEAQALVDRLYVIAEGMQVTGKTKDGKEGSRPLRFSYGIGESLEEADRNMLAHKEQRARQGLRAERGTTAAADMATTDAGQMELFADPVAAPVVQETAPVAQEPVVAEAPVEPAPAPRPRRERVQRAKTTAAIAPEPLDAELTPAIADDPFAQVSEEEALRAEMQQPARADALGALLDRPRTLRDLKHNVVQSIDELPAEIRAMLGSDMSAVQVGDTLHVVADRIRGPRTMQVMQLRSAVVRSRGPAWLFRGLWSGVLDFFEGSVDNIRKSLTTIAEGGEDELGLQLLEAIRIQARERGLWSEVEVSAAEAVSYFSNTDDARSYTPKMAMRGAKVTGSGISRSVLDRSLQPFLAKGYKIVVEETPPATAPDAKGGITDDGTIYLYRSMISDRADLLRVLRHELVGHLGMRAVVGEGNWDSIKRAVLSSTDSRIRDLLLEVERRYPGESVNTQVNEVFAIAAERDPDGNIFTRLWGVIRAALRRAGLVTGEMTWSELQGMLMASSIASKIAPSLVRGAQSSGMLAGEGRESTVPPHRVMYSRGDTQVHTPTPEEKFDRMMPAALSNAFGLKPGGMDWRSIFDGVKAAALPYILKVAPLTDVGEVFGNQFRTTWRGRAVDFVREYQRLMQEQSRVTDGRRVQAFHTVQQWADMTGEAAKKLNAALEFATLRNLRLGLPVEKQPWTFEQWAESGNLKRFGYLDENVKEMNRLWDQVPESHKKVWREAEQDMSRMFDEVKDAVKNMVSRNLGDSDRAEMVLKEIDQKYQKLKGTYVPLMRFGDYGIAEYTFDEELGQWTKTADFRYDTAAKALNAFERLRKGKDPEKVRYQQYSQLEALEQRLSPMDTSIFQAIRNAVEQALGGSDVPPESVKANVDTIMGMVSDLFIEDLPERAFAHHEQHRSGMPGYSTDFARSYENYILRGSAVLGAVRYGSQRTALLRDMKDFLIASRSPDFQAPEGFKPYHAAAVYNSLVEREAMLTMNPGWVVPSLSKLTFLQLLTSPSQWLVNLSQVPLVWLPLAAGRWGMSKASSVMINTMRDAMSGKYKADRILADDVTEHVNKIFARNPETDEFLLTKDQRDREIEKLPTYMQELVALRQLADSGKMQLGYAHALLAGAEHGHDTIAGSWGRTVDSVMHYVSFFMRHSEEVNRKVSMLGAFRLARQQGKKFTDALEDGFYFTDRSQYDYTRQNRVPLLKHGAARLMLQVQSFRIMTLAMLASEAYKAFRKGDREAARALGWLQGTSALIAGIRGMPVYGLGMLLMSALQAIGVVGDEEDPKDFNMEVELGLRGMFGDRLGTGLSRGIPAMFGMDLHSRTQLANLHESSMMSPPESLTGAARANWQAAVLIGPAWNNVVNFHKLTQALDRGDPMLKAAAELLPKPMKDAINTSYVLFDEEPIRGAGGRAILEAQQVGGYPLLLMGLGIMPTVITTRKIEDRYVNDRATVIGQTRTRIVAHLSRAIMDNDAQAIEEWGQRAIDFNNRNPAYGIMGEDLRASITQRYKKDLGIPTDNYIYEAQRTLGGQYQPIPSMM